MALRFPGAPHWRGLVRRNRLTPVETRSTSGRAVEDVVELVALFGHVTSPVLHEVGVGLDTTVVEGPVLPCAECPFGVGDRRTLAGADLERHPGEAEQHDLADQVVEIDPHVLPETREVEQVALDSVVDAHTNGTDASDAHTDHQHLLTQGQHDVVDLGVVAPGEAQHHHGQCETKERHHHDGGPVVRHHAEVDDHVVVIVPDLDAAVGPHRHQVEQSVERESAQTELLDLAHGESPFVLQPCTVHSCRFRSNTV